jgi:hypothetical protein
MPSRRYPSAGARARLWAGGNLSRQGLAPSTPTVGGGADYAAVAELERDERARPVAMWRALRLDPRHAAEVSVLYALPQLMPHVEYWLRTNVARHPTEPPDKMARRVLRRSTSVARRGGLITGTSFYVGMLPAMAMIYFEQLTAVLRIAAVFGRDPTEPDRAAEILVIQGRYSTVAEASVALQVAGLPATQRPIATDARTMGDVVRQLPSMIGLHARKVRAASPIDLIVAAVEVASFVVPVVSIPIWTIASARAMRRLGRAAMAFYAHEPVDEREAAPAVRLPPRPTPRTRRLVIGTIVPLALALGVVITLLPINRWQHGLLWLGLVLGELTLLLTFARLIRITRLPAGSA